jgi:hypothetical protein
MSAPACLAKPQPLKYLAFRGAFEQDSREMEKQTACPVLDKKVTHFPSYCTLASAKIIGASNRAFPSPCSKKTVFGKAGWFRTQAAK